jgi:hypothetical protein
MYDTGRGVAHDDARAVQQGGVRSRVADGRAVIPAR